MAFRQTVTHGSLPHWFMPGAANLVTDRLVETLPLEVLRKLRADRDRKIQQARICGHIPCGRPAAFGFPSRVQFLYSSAPIALTSNPM